MFFGKTKSPEQNSQPPSAGQPQDVIFEANVQNFEERVMMASMERPVIAYFTASWCGPCKQLGPVMDKVVGEAAGQVLMAKIDLDANQELAAALRIQSVPTILAFFQGRPVDAFQGAVPESHVRQFIEKLVNLARGAQPDALDIPEALKGAAQALAERDYGPAQAIYAQILEQEPNNVQAFVGLVRVYIAAGHVEEAQALVESAPESIVGDAAFNEAKSALELAQSTPAGDVAELQAKVEANPKDHGARYDLAMALFAGGQREVAMDHMLEILTQNREWNEEAARHQMLKFFEAMGNADPLTIEYRKKLSSILFS